ncbi:outer membrane protein assembly factor BamD [Flavobacterium sp. CYK-4]|uniref:outer membrane protein assembly factor BamD n=1 Tax=Flavobacterium lotistagni TaxID=2709660 RepID=UPI00140E3211|nr:outer membrane protein assembly factor BamD [Flavobacterium lotistagni]NHM07753.1 outer membrane protein assembly factor BamD [Flavobacterium lotistagni]
MNKFLYFLLVTVLLASCSPYQKALKSDDVAVKYAEAEKKYEAKKYNKAIRLFEQMAPAFRGKPQSEKMFYMFAQSYFKTEQYYLAGYQFESFVSSYPKSEKLEEAAYLEGKSYSMLSPPYSLDQIDTVKAIDKLQTFIDTYPNSVYLPEANATLKGLTDKLEKKYYEIAKQYNTISDHKAALVALDNFISEYPGTKYKEAALYYRLDSAYKLAINSIPAKMEERLHNAKIAYTNLMKFKADTSYKEKADDMLARIDKDLQQYSNK